MYERPTGTFTVSTVNTQFADGGSVKLQAEQLKKLEDHTFKVPFMPSVVNQHIKVNDGFFLNLSCTGPGIYVNKIVEENLICLLNSTGALKAIEKVLKSEGDKKTEA